MMEKIPVSIFHLEKNTHIEETTINGETDGNRAPGERPVITALHKYGFMNKNLIQKNLIIYGHKKINAGKVLLKMQKQGKIRKYTISHDESSLADLDIYTLNDDYRQMGKREQADYKRDMQDIAYILENMALCQWHNGLLSNSFRCKEILYNRIKYCSAGSVVIPSIIKVKMERKSIYLCAVPENRANTAESLRAFIIKLIFINQYLADNRSMYPSYLIVLIGESIKQIEERAKLLSMMKETREMDIIFTIDMATSMDDPLKNIYNIRRAENSSELIRIRI